MARAREIRPVPEADRRSFEALLVSQLALVDSHIQFLVRRHHLNADDAEEFNSFVKLSLLDNDFEILRKFQGRSSLGTYLLAVVQRLLLDYCEKTWGCWRPSMEARRLGLIALQLERLLVRDGLSLDQAFETLKTNLSAALTWKEVQDLSLQLPRRFPPRRFVGVQELATLATDGSELDAAILRAEQRPLVRKTQAVLSRAMKLLDPRDRLILRMRFEEGFSILQIASAFHMNRNRVSRRIDRAFRTLRTALQAEGIGAPEVRSLLGHPRLALVGFAPSKPSRNFREPSI